MCKYVQEPRALIPENAHHIHMQSGGTTADDAVIQPKRLAVKQTSSETTAVRHLRLAVET